MTALALLPCILTLVVMRKSRPIIPKIFMAYFEEAQSTPSQYLNDYKNKGSLLMIIRKASEEDLILHQSTWRNKRTYKRRNYVGL